jgi:glutamate-1-semialdehyde 2,1-aminomutase
VNSPVRAFKSVGGEPFFVSHGEGAYLFDYDGNRYVDFIMSWGPLVLGHAHSSVVSAISQQVVKGTTYGAPNVSEIHLAQEICKWFPSIEKIRFVSSGTEAGISVIRLARGFTNRSRILKFRGCYHGHVDSLLVSAGSGVATLSLPDSPGILPELASATIVVEYNDLDGVERAVKKYGDELAAIIVEPVVGNSGFITPNPGFLEGLRNQADKCGALLIFDEVMTGFRVALGGAQTLFKVEPDLTMLGKVIGGGLPVGAFGGRREIMAKISPEGSVYQAGTLSGNPLAMVAGYTSILEWTSNDRFYETQQATESFVKGMKDSADRHGIPLQTAVIGTMFGFFFSETPVRNYEDALKSNRDLFNSFFHLSLERGVYFAPSAFEAGFTSLMHIGKPFMEALTVVDDIFSHLAIGHLAIGTT